MDSTDEKVEELIRAHHHADSGTSKVVGGSREHGSVHAPVVSDTIVSVTIVSVTIVSVTIVSVTIVSGTMARWRLIPPRSGSRR
jgi:hypothetical protein